MIQESYVKELALKDAAIEKLQEKIVELKSTIVKLNDGNRISSQIEVKDLS